MVVGMLAGFAQLRRRRVRQRVRGGVGWRRRFMVIGLPTSLTVGKREMAQVYSPY